uniref:Uncharacterized protein n=1 Tax=Triticum urartu TaxID=4572 RepID=A0A8R7UNK8_TRIUA
MGRAVAPGGLSRTWRSEASNGPHGLSKEIKAATSLGPPDSPSPSRPSPSSRPKLILGSTIESPGAS